MDAVLPPLDMILVDDSGIVEAWILFIEYFLDIKVICIHTECLYFLITILPRHSAVVRQQFSLPSILS